MMPLPPRTSPIKRIFSFCHRASLRDIIPAFRRVSASLRENVSRVFVILCEVSVCVFCAFLWLIPSPASAQSTGELIKNGGFEGGSGADGRGAGVPRWNAFGLGYEVDRSVFHSGEQSVRCDSLRLEAFLGAEQEVTLSQTHAAPIIVSAWSKADSVSGVKNSDYGLYIDLEYMDGTSVMGARAAQFGAGTHGMGRGAKFSLRQ